MMQEPPILSVEHLKKSFGEHEVLRDITFEVPQGDVVSIIGSSGSGKSTLLRCINFLEEPTDGRILFRGKNAETEWTRAQYHSKVGMVFQSFNLFNNMSVLKNCMMGQMKVLHRGKAEAEEKALLYLEKVGMAPIGTPVPDSFPAGQKRAWLSHGAGHGSPKCCSLTSLPARWTRKWWARCSALCGSWRNPA